MAVIGIVSPGAMGSALARAWTAGGAHVVATVAGRSARTRGLAHGLELLPTLADVVAASDLVVSICPPGAAEACTAGLLDAAAATRARPLVADLNAVSPRLVRALAARTEAAGLGFVDGSISGGPPGPGSDTMLFLSGPRADEVAALDTDGLRRRVVGPEPGTASAVKMCTASIYKGTAALWSQALQTAARLDVLDIVLDDLREVYPDDVAGAARRLAMAASKSERYVAEMEQISRTQAAAGATAELFAGMAAVYTRLARTPLATLSPEEASALDDLSEVLRRLAP
jgi:3-hydroxyisobutyrate dehydrogenase-like beta-hydroxyacid dehydrogenase